MTELTILTGQQLKLIPFKAEHICDSYIEWLNDPEVNRFLEVRFVHQTYETVLHYAQSFYGDTEKYMWGVYPQHSEILIGTATLSEVNRRHQRGVIGLMIGEKEYWGKSHGTEIIRLIADFAFSKLRLHKVTAGAVADNSASIKAFQRADFKIEGHLKSHDFSDNIFRDTVLMGLVNPGS